MARLDAQFAGSQKVAERRRRRLAVETDQPRDSADPSLPAPEGESRFADGPHRLQADDPDLSRLKLPVSAFVPAAWWKCALGALLTIGVATLLVAASWFEHEWALVAGPGFSQLLGGPERRVATWYSSLLLALAGQLAFVIWWGRSRSLTDFGGRYRLWVRAAAVWFCFSFSVGTGAHNAWADTIMSLGPPPFWRNEALWWLAPAALLGLTLLAALHRELAGSRASRAFLYAAAAAYTAAAVLRLELVRSIAHREQEVALLAASLAGNVCLFLCMWLFARHVWHVNPEPVRRKQRSRKIPRPHFRITLWPFAKRAVDGAVTAEESEPFRASRKSRKPALQKSKAPEALESETRTEEPAPGDGARLRVDASHGRVEAKPPAATVAHRASALPPGTRAEPVELRDLSSQADRECDDSETEGIDESAEDQLPKPDMRGLSKKQRRRLMQELRERERLARRQ